MKRIIAILLILASVLSFGSCNPSSLPKEMPEDFTLYVQWGTFGDSSYSSETGKLVKDFDIDGKYSTTYVMPKEDLKEAYSIIRKLGIDKFPKEFSQKELQGSSPYCIFTIKATINGETYSVTAKQVSGYDGGRSIRTIRFLNAVESIVTIITSSDEWKSIPESGDFYE